MKKILLTTLIFFLSVSVFTLSAQRSEKFTGALLWKVSGKGLSQPSYILGTHHLASVDYIDDISGLRNAMENTQQVAGEIIMGERLELQNRVMQSAMLPQGQSYKDFLSDADYNTLDEELKKIFGAGLTQMGILKPGIISMTFAIVAFSKAYPEINLTTHVSIDEYMQQYAIKEGKLVIGLETIDAQIDAILGSEPLQTQAEQLVCSVSNFDFAIESLKELTSYYYKGQLVEMYDISFNDPKDPCPTSEGSQYALLRNRNNKWIEQLPQIMKDKPTLVVVGALHLAGEEGLLFQLDKMGYSIEMVK